jgi:hypothetical protein
LNAVAMTREKAPPFKQRRTGHPKILSQRPGHPPKIAKGNWRIYEVPISYSGRTYAEGKKITWKDGVKTLWCIFRYNLLP